MYHDRRTVALVPIKAHSARVPGKNFRPFSGRPLFHHILTELHEVAGIDEILVDTDSDEVTAEAPKLGDRITVTHRPADLRGDEVSVNALISHDMAVAEADIYLQTHATNPLLKSATIHRAILTFLEREQAGFDSVFGVNRIQTRLYREDASPINHDPSELLPTQDLPPVYEENSLLYVFTPGSFAKRNARIGARPHLFETPRLESIDIDDEFQFRIAELIAMYVK